MGKVRHVFFFIIFMLFLLFVRLWWWSENKIIEVEIVNGQASIENVLNDYGAYLLNGEWDFYASEFLLLDEINNKSTMQKKITVPGNWSESLNNTKNNPIGFGTYHLKIIPPKEEMLISLHFLSIRSASSVYINDRLMFNQGHVGKNKEDYEAKNLPFRVTFLKDEHEEYIDLIVHVANFKDKRGGGIVKSVQIGTQESVSKNIEFTKIFQNITSILFCFLAIAIIFLSFIIKDIRLLFFAITLFSLSILFALSSEEKILHQALKFSYDFSFKLGYMLQVIIAASLGALYLKFANAHQRMILYSYLLLSPILLIIIMSVNITFLTGIAVVFPLYVAISMTLVLVMLTRAIKERSNNIYLMFALGAIICQLSWWLYSIVYGLTLIYYPFDLLFTLFWLIIAWFKHYSDLYNQKETMNNELKVINENKNEYLLLNSFQMRTPLKKMLDINKLLLDSKSSLNNFQIKQLASAQKIGVELSLVIDNIINIYQMKSENVECAKEIIYPDRKIKHIERLFAPYFLDKQIKINNQIDEKTSPIISNGQWFIQIYYNLFDFAYIILNKSEIKIWSEIKHKNVKLILHMSDYKMRSDKIITILTSDHKKTNYEQLFNEKGFGDLILVNLLVTLQGGKFNIYVKDDGTYFEIELKKAEIDAKKINNKDDSVFKYIDNINTESKSVKKHNILIISNDRKQLHYMKNVLNNSHNKIIISESFNHAITLVRNIKVDLIISDVILVERNGYELIKEIRKYFTIIELPAILIPTKKYFVDIHEIYNSGANDYIEKPIDITELNARVESLLYTKKVTDLAIKFEGSWLQAQIEPHFLFNTLNTIIGLSSYDEEKMQEVLEAFMDVLHSKYKYNQADELIPLEEEIKLVKSYLLIEKTRYEDKLIVNWNIEADITSVKIIPLVIQPIIENAIKHGVLKKKGQGVVKISIKEIGYDLKIKITDNGPGTDEKLSEFIYQRNNSKDVGIGIVNTNQRLEKAFGRGIEFESKKGYGTTVIITVPFKDHGGN